MLRRKPRLVATHQQDSLRIGRAQCLRAHARFNRTTHSLPPAVVVNGNRAPRLNRLANRVELRAQHGKHRRSAGLGSHADGAIQQRFSLVLEQLLGLAQAAASARGKNDGGNRHRVLV